MRGVISLLVCLVLAVGSTAGTAPYGGASMAPADHGGAYASAEASPCEGAECAHHHESRPCITVVGHCTTALLLAARHPAARLASLDARMGFGGDAVTATRMPEMEPPPPRV